MKYAVLLLALMFPGCGVGSTTDGAYETFTIAGETMQVAKEDFPSRMKWDDAMSACAGLGNGWRLPSRQEQLVMYQQLQMGGKGNFKEDNYWSSSELNEVDAWCFDFANGQASVNSTYFPRRVRAIRALP